MFVEKFLTFTAVVVTMSETNIGFPLTAPEKMLPAESETVDLCFCKAVGFHVFFMRFELAGRLFQSGSGSGRPAIAAD